MTRFLKLLSILLALLLLLTACASPEIDESAAPSTPPVETEQPADLGDAAPDAQEGFAQITPEPTEEMIIVEELVDVDDLRINADLDEKGWWNILLLGSDSRDMNNYYGLTDTIIILSIHPADGTAKLTSVMRDTWVDIYGIGQRKINSANVYGGPELIMRTVNEHFGMNISNYVLVGMEALTDIIDMIGGVTFDITKAEMDMINRQLTYDAEDFKLNDATPLTEYGERVTVTGNQALAYVRIRALDSDYVRTERQRAVLMAIANSLQESDMRTLASAIAVLATYVQTNLSLTQMVALATTGLSIDLANVEELRLPADGTFVSDTYDGVWSIRPNYEKNQAILHEFIYGAPGTTDADAVTAN